MFTEKLDSLFASYFKPDEPGAAVLIARNNEVIYKNGFGISDIHTKELITPKTIFNLGSISKTFVAYGILKLAHEKMLNLDDNLYQYFPDFTRREIAEKVHIIHLLTHTSGLPDSRNVKENHDFYLWAKDEENFAPLKNTTELEFEPGTKYRYSNPAFNGLALIIEKRSGMKWQEYIRKNIFEPSLMKMSTITDGPHPSSGVAHAYVKKSTGGYDELDYGEEPTFAAAGNGGVWSNVEELWNYEKAIRNHTFLPGEVIHFSRSLYPFKKWQDSIASRLGVSWFITQSAGNPMIGHTGSQGGFVADYCWYPANGIFYVLLCNTPVSLPEIRAKVMEILQ
jgi:CubicO group peptidase (beta-lactamase class C family)